MSRTPVQLSLLRARPRTPERCGSSDLRSHGVDHRVLVWRARPDARRRSCTTSSATPARNARPSLVWALEQLAERKADALVVPRLRDLSRNVANLPPLLSWFDERAPAADRDRPRRRHRDRGRPAAGGAVAGVGGWEHEQISQRTRRGLEAARSRGGGQGRTAVADVPELAERIQAMREQGMTLQAIADRSTRKACRRCAAARCGGRRASSAPRATAARPPPAAASYSRRASHRVVCDADTQRVGRGLRGPLAPRRTAPEESIPCCSAPAPSDAHDPPFALRLAFGLKNG